MKKEWISTIILCIIFIVTFTYRDDISRVVMQTVTQNKKIAVPKDNTYSDNFEFAFVKETNDFHAKNYQHILDILYTVLDSGTDEFTFYCDSSYKKCLEDFGNISKDQVLLSTINNMVSPYNSYEKIYFKISSYGKIVVNIDKLYNDDEVKKIEESIEKFNTENIKDDMSVKDKIKTFHDYLINNSVYDKERANTIESGSDEVSSNSHKATGPLVDGLSLCSGYSDAMKIYLDKLKVPNYKVSNDNHIWNVLKLDDSWLHVDLTWDDPVTNTGENVLLHKFFLIDTKTLLDLDASGHEFNKDYYIEISH